jgi:hypothetical protein
MSVGLTAADAATKSFPVWANLIGKEPLPSRVLSEVFDTANIPDPVEGPELDPILVSGLETAFADRISETYPSPALVELPELDPSILAQMMDFGVFDEPSQEELALAQSHIDRELAIDAQEQFLEDETWADLFAQTVFQPTVISDPENLRIEGAWRREVFVEFAAMGMVVTENGAGMEPGSFFRTEVASGLPAMAAPLARYLEAALDRAGLDAGVIGECFSVSFLRRLVETEIALIGLDDVPVPGFRAIISSYYHTVTSRLLRRCCDQLDQYERITLSCPQWLQPFVQPCAELHPQIRVEVV